jgi:hypothetical protein
MTGYRPTGKSDTSISVSLACTWNIFAGRNLSENNFLNYRCQFLPVKVLFPIRRFLMGF